MLRSFNVNNIFKRTYDRFAFRDYRGFPIQLEAWPFVYISEQGTFREYFSNQLIAYKYLRLAGRGISSALSWSLASYSNLPWHV